MYWAVRCSICPHRVPLVTHCMIRDGDEFRLSISMAHRFAGQGERESVFAAAGRVVAAYSKAGGKHQPGRKGKVPKKNKSIQLSFRDKFQGLTYFSINVKPFVQSNGLRVCFWCCHDGRYPKLFTRARVLCVSFFSIQLAFICDACVRFDSFPFSFLCRDWGW